MGKNLTNTTNDAHINTHVNKKKIHSGREFVRQTKSTVVK